MNIEQIKKEFPIGKSVKFYPIKGVNNFREVEIRSEPWVVCGEVVIKVTGVSGCVSVEHLA